MKSIDHAMENARARETLSLSLVAIITIAINILFFTAWPASASELVTHKGEISGHSVRVFEYDGGDPEVARYSIRLCPAGDLRCLGGAATPGRVLGVVWRDPGIVQVTDPGAHSVEEAQRLLEEGLRSACPWALPKGDEYEI